MSIAALNKRVAYLGDGSIPGAASYLSGVMKHFGIEFDRVDSTDPVPSDFFDAPYSLYILSDYPAGMFRPGELERIAGNVENHGSGLLMIGGWESFHGRLGEYNNTVAADLLPVVMAAADDRRNWPLSVILRTVASHVIVEGLPWNTPPGIGGYNQFTPKADAKTLIEGIRLDLQVLGDQVETLEPVSENDFALLAGRRIIVPLIDGDSIAIQPCEAVPMLVVGEYGLGRTAAFASDVAPHWVGGFVDWGTERMVEEIGPPGDFIEVGADYAKFWRNLVRWTARL